MTKDRFQQRDAEREERLTVSRVNVTDATCAGFCEIEIDALAPFSHGIRLVDLVDQRKTRVSRWP
jgi:hypothetical protein